MIASYKRDKGKAMTKNLTLGLCVLALFLSGCAPTAKTYTGQQVVDAFKAAGLEAEGARPMTKADYGLAPFVATEGTRFLIPSLGADKGGRVMTFASAADLNKTKTFYVELGRNSAALFSWTYDSGNILVQINGDLPEVQAKKYQAAMMGLTK